jgi:hypothetical protein
MRCDTVLRYSAFTDCGGKNPSTVPYCSNASQQCGTVSESVGASRGTAFLYAESGDGVSGWVKPNLGLAEWKGSTANNIVNIGGMTTGVRGVFHSSSFTSIRSCGCEQCA